MFELAGNAVEIHGHRARVFHRIPRKKVETPMKLTNHGASKGTHLKRKLIIVLTPCLLATCLLWLACVGRAYAQTVSTTTVQGTVYLASGLAGPPGPGALEAALTEVCGSLAEQMAADARHRPRRLSGRGAQTERRLLHHGLSDAARRRHFDVGASRQHLQRDRRL